MNRWWRRQGAPLALPGKHLRFSRWTAHAQTTQASWDKQRVSHYLTGGWHVLWHLVSIRGQFLPKTKCTRNSKCNGASLQLSFLAGGGEDLIIRRWHYLSSSLPCWARISLLLSFSPPKVKWEKYHLPWSPIILFCSSTDLRYLKHLRWCLAYSRLSTMVATNNSHS